MSDEIASKLEELGHADLAEMLKRRDLARELRAHGREDLAERVEAQRPISNPATLDFDAVLERSQQVGGRPGRPWPGRAGASQLRLQAGRLRR